MVDDTASPSNNSQPQPLTDEQKLFLQSVTPNQIQLYNKARIEYQAMCGIRPAWLDAKETAQDMKDAPFNDASPMLGVSNFAQYNVGPTYYFLSDPTEVEQIIMARKTAVGWRLTWGLTIDAWNNKFKLRYSQSDGKPLNDEESELKNTDLHKHLMETKFYEAGKKADGYDGELGESLIFVHRSGEDLSPGSDYLTRPANKQLPVIRFEAISKVDYIIRYVEQYGNPQMLRISFRSIGGKIITYEVHPSHCVRIRANHVDYDQYKGQSRLKPVFPDITVLVLISKSGADLMNRIGPGKPVLSVPNVRSKEDLTKARNMVGNVTQQEWIVKPIEVTLELLSGTAQMGDLMAVANLYYNNICMASQLPRTILMGENLGVYGGEVPQAEYYNVLDRHHGIMEDFMREALQLDPWFVAFIGDNNYDFDWGLRHVMSQAEEIDYRTKVLTIMGEAQGVGMSNNAIRAIGKFPTFEEEYKALEDSRFAEIFFGFTKQEIANLPAKLWAGLQDAVIEQIRFEMQSELGGKDLEVDTVPGSEGGKAKPPLPSKKQANPHEIQGNSMPKDQRPKAALPEGEMRREKVGDAAVESEVLDTWQDDIAESIMKFDDMPGFRSKLIDKMPVSNGTMYKFFDWALGRMQEVRSRD